MFSLLPMLRPLGGDQAFVVVDEDVQVRVLPFVREAEQAVPDSYTQAALPSDPYMSYAWALHNTGSASIGTESKAGADVGALTAWQHSRGENVIVAVMDSGYDDTHPELADALRTNPDEGCDPAVDRDGNGLRGDCHGWNFNQNNNDLRNVINGTVAGSHGT